jgi:short chain dehydrogenase
LQKRKKTSSSTKASGRTNGSLDWYFMEYERSKYGKAYRKGCSHYGSGIGLATAKRFVSEGAYVFISGRRQDELDKAVAILGSGVRGVQGDVSNLDDLDRLFATVQAEKGHEDVLFANAGIGNMSPLSAMRTSPRGVSVGSQFLFRSESGFGEGDRRRVKGEAMNTSDISEAQGPEGNTRPWA